MKKTVLFDLIFKDDILNGKAKVITARENEVQILTFNRNHITLPIVAMIKRNNFDEIVEYDRLGHSKFPSDDLYLVIEEETPILTEFEKEYSNLRYGNNATSFMTQNYNTVRDIKKEAKEFLEIAKKEIIKNHLPKWKQDNIGTQNYLQNNILHYNGFTINVDELYTILTIDERKL